MNKKIKIEGETPNKADLDYMEKAIQRHTGDFDAWWKQNCLELSGRDWLNVIITAWEAGRAKKGINSRRKELKRACKDKTHNGLCCKNIGAWIDQGT